jgi:hypothetical protein
MEDRLGKKNDIKKVSEKQIIEKLMAHKRYYEGVIFEKLDLLESRELIHELEFAVDGIAPDNHEVRKLLKGILKKFGKNAGIYIKTEDNSLIWLAKEIKRQLKRGAPDGKIKLITDKIREILENLESVHNILHKYHLGDVKFLTLDARAQILSAAELSGDKYKKYDFALSLLWGLSKIRLRDKFDINEICEKLREITMERDITNGKGERALGEKPKIIERKIKGEEKLTVDESGVIWEGKRLDFKEISGLNWGSMTGKRDSMTGKRGSMTGKKEEGGDKESKTQKIVINGGKGDFINLRIEDEYDYNLILNAIWSAAGYVIIYKILNDLKGGKGYNYKNLTFEDENLTEERKGGAKPKIYKWRKILLDAGKDALKIKTSGFRFVVAEIEFLDFTPLRALQMIIETAQKFKLTKLSDLLKVGNIERSN